jgi:hypothetical protein
MILWKENKNKEVYIDKKIKEQKQNSTAKRESVNNKELNLLSKDKKD